MSIVFLNDKFIDENEAKVSVNDAGYYFGDGVYDVILIYNRQLKDTELHLNRLMSCLERIYFKNYPVREEILSKIYELLNLNPDIENGSIYCQFTRGTTPRSHDFFNLNLKPNWFMKISSYNVNFDFHMTWSCNIVEDPRRMDCDIKMISLMPMVLAKYDSEKLGFDDVIFYNSRVNSITEGSSFNVFIVDNNNTIITYPISKEILPGCTRARAISLIKEHGYKIEERKYSKDELLNAKEVFATASLKPIIPILKVCNKDINDGKIGNITKEINNLFIEYYS